MNVQKDNRKKYQNEIPMVDEGWWESVLAEEQKFTPQHSKAVVSNANERTEESRETGAVSVDWDTVRQFYNTDRIVEVKVTGHNRGGLLVEGEGLSGFIPLSHLIELAGRDAAVDREQSLAEYMGRTMKVKVIECAPEEERVICSERAALSEPGRRVELFHNLAVGMQVNGTVTNITDFGVFVDLGGVEGLIHISELSWGRVSHPKQLVELGQEIAVQVLDISAERCRVALSRKRLLPNPWEMAEEAFPIGSIVTGTVTSVLSYGAFASLEVGVEGLIHATEMPLASGQSPRDILSVGQTLRLRVLHVDANRQRLGFSMNLDHK